MRTCLMSLAVETLHFLRKNNFFSKIRVAMAVHQARHSANLTRIRCCRQLLVITSVFAITVTV